MDVHDLKFLFEVIDVKAQSKSTEDPNDANLRRFKWWFWLSNGSCWLLREGKS